MRKERDGKRKKKPRWTKTGTTFVLFIVNLSSHQVYYRVPFGMVGDNRK